MIGEDDCRSGWGMLFRPEGAVDGLPSVPWVVLIVSPFPRLFLHGIDWPVSVEPICILTQILKIQHVGFLKATVSLHGSPPHRRAQSGLLFVCDKKHLMMTSLCQLDYGMSRQLVRRYFWTRL